MVRRPESVEIGIMTSAYAGSVYSRNMPSSSAKGRVNFGR